MLIDTEKLFHIINKKLHECGQNHDNNAADLYYYRELKTNLVRLEEYWLDNYNNIYKD